MTEKEILAAMLATAAVMGGAEKKDTETPKIDRDKIRKQSEDIGNAYYHIYEGFKDAGFNDEQAFKLLIQTIRSE